MADPLRFGTLGVARITPGGLTGPAADNPDAIVAAVAARDRSRAEAFAKKHSIESVYDSYDEVILDPTLDVIYNPLPISHHHEYTIKALRAGKHVMCEKSFALNAAEAEEMAAVARETGLVSCHACSDASEYAMRVNARRGPQGILDIFPRATTRQWRAWRTPEGRVPRRPWPRCAPWQWN